MNPFYAKRLLILCISFAMLQQGQSQELQLTSQVGFGGPGEDGANEIIALEDGGFVYCGYASQTGGDVTESFALGDIWIVKADANHEIVWEKTFGDAQNETGYDIASLPDGSILVIGISASTAGNFSGNHGNYDSWMARLDANGNLLWQLMIGGSLNDFLRSIAITPEGDIVGCGVTASNDGDLPANALGSWDAFVCKVSQSGELLWTTRYGGSGDDGFEKIICTEEGNIHGFGYSNSLDGQVEGLHGGYDSWYAQMDASGTFVQQKTFGGTGDEAFQNAIPSPTGFFGVGSSTSSDGDISGHLGFADQWVLSFDFNSDLIWEKSIGSLGNDYGKYVLPWHDGVIIAGTTGSATGDFSNDVMGGLDFTAVYLNSSGETQSIHRAGGSNDDILYGATVSEDALILCGASFSLDGDVLSNLGSSDSWIAFFSEPLNVPNIKEDIKLWPNPTNGIAYLQSVEVIDKVSVSNSLGQVLENTMSTKAPFHQCSINVSDQPSGVYFVQIHVDGKSHLFKILKN